MRRISQQVAGASTVATGQRTASLALRLTAAQHGATIFLLSLLSL
jgi:hypothetical protein